MAKTKWSSTVVFAALTSRAEANDQNPDALRDDFGLIQAIANLLPDDRKRAENVKRDTMPAGGASSASVASRAWDP